MQEGGAMSELKRMIKALETGQMCGGRNNPQSFTKKDVARVLFDMAKDFGTYRAHRPHCPKATCDNHTAERVGIECTCGLDAAYERWRVL